MGTSKNKQKTPKKVKDECEDTQNPIARWFCKSSFAKTFIYDSNKKLGDGLRMSLRDGPGLLFYLTLIIGYVLAATILAKQYFHTINFNLPYDAVEIYFAFLAAFVFTNELDKWGMKKEEFRLFRKGENALIMWLVVLLASWSLNIFMDKPPAQELKWVIGGVLIAYAVSKISTYIKLKECSGTKKSTSRKKRK